MSLPHRRKSRKKEKKWRKRKVEARCKEELSDAEAHGLD
jgi:hypothetical protein